MRALLDIQHSTAHTHILADMHQNFMIFLFNLEIMLLTPTHLGRKERRNYAFLQPNAIFSLNNFSLSFSLFLIFPLSLSSRLRLQNCKTTIGRKIKISGETPAAVQHNHCSKVKAYSINVFIFPLGMMLIFYKNFYISEL
jgi:hypothetical protein